MPDRRREYRLWLLPVFALLVAVAPGRFAQADPTPGSAPTSTPSATDIYYRALAHLKELSSAPYVEYVMRQVNTTIDGRIVLSIDESVRERRRDRASWNLVTARSAGPRAWSIGDVTIGQHYLVPDAFLPLLISRVQTKCCPAEANEMMPGFAKPEDQSLQTNATVPAVASPIYAVIFLGWADLADCGKVAHLGLRSLHDPERYNVRELWVRTSDDVLCKAIYNSHLYRDQRYRDPPGSMVITATLDDRGLITSWRSTTTMNALGGPFRTLDYGEFFSVSWSNQEANYFFDRTLWDAHVKSAPPSGPPRNS
jgi:hypothetical protein